MKRHYRILIITDLTTRPAGITANLNRFSFIPGNRERNYTELLSGLGIPFDIKDVNTFRAHTRLTQKEIYYSAILFASPLGRIPTDVFAFLQTYSSEQGVSLIADTFLMSGKDVLPPFGLQNCSGLCLNIRAIKDNEGNLLYQSIRHPYSARGFDLGVRPLLRFCLQNWLSKKIVLKNDAVPLAYYGKSHPAVVSAPFGRAVNYVFNFHPSLVLNAGNRMHAFIRDLFESNPRITAASIDLSRTACLRLDDPGSCERVHLEGYNPGVLGKHPYRQIFKILSSRNAHLNIAYIPLWIDDGNSAKGDLISRDRPVTDRKPGSSYNSWEVIYSRSSSHPSHDYVAEFQAILEGIAAGRVSVLSHGLTHLCPDVHNWAKAADQYTNLNWYREFRNSPSGQQPQKKQIVARMKKSADLIHKIFGIRPEILVPSAHEYTPLAPQWAREAGYAIFSGDSTFLLYNDVILQNRKVRAFYAEDRFSGISFCKAGYPIIFVFHDYDIYRHGAGWLDEQILMLEGCGVERFYSMEQLGFLLMTRVKVTQANSVLELEFDFKNSLKHMPLEGELPLRIGAEVVAMEVNDQRYVASFKIVNQKTFFSIPFSKIIDSRLHVNLKLSPLRENL